MARKKNVIQDLKDPLANTENELSLSKLTKQVDDTDFEMVEVFGNGEFISPQEVEQKVKGLLSERKKQAMLMMDGKKLEEMMKALNGLEFYSDIMFDPDVMGRVKDSVGSAKDLKYISEAYGNIIAKLPILSRLDTVDSSGTARELDFVFEFNDGNGQSIKFAKGK